MGTMQRSLDTPFPHMIERDKDRLSFLPHRHVWLWKAPPSTFSRIFASVSKDNGKHKFRLLSKDFKALSADVSFPHIEKVSNNDHILSVHSLFFYLILREVLETHHFLLPLKVCKNCGKYYTYCDFLRIIKILL